MLKPIVVIVGFALLVIVLALIGGGYVNSLSTAYRLIGILMAAGTLLGIINKLEVNSTSLLRYTFYGIAAIIAVWAVYNAAAHFLGFPPMTLDGLLNKLTGGLWGKITSKLSLGG